MGLADIVEKYCRKGERLFVEGSIEYGQYKDKEGQTRYTTEIKVRELMLLGGKGGGSDFDSDSDSGRSRAPAAARVGQRPTRAASTISLRHSKTRTTTYLSETASRRPCPHPHP